jgi:hypothetical protein
MQTSKISVDAEERDKDLENIIGNLVVAEYQVDRLRNKLVEKIVPSYRSVEAKDRSAFAFKLRDKWYRVSVRVEQENEIPAVTSEAEKVKN